MEQQDNREVFMGMTKDEKYVVLGSDALDALIKEGWEEDLLGALIEAIAERARIKGYCIATVAPVEIVEREDIPNDV